MRSMHKLESKPTHEDESIESNWGNFSNNYISATGPNGHTVLASRSASSLSVKTTPKHRTRASLTKKSRGTR